MSELSRNFIYLKDGNYGGLSLYRMSIDPQNLDSCERYSKGNVWDKIPYGEAAEMELLTEITYDDAIIIQKRIENEE